MRLTTTIIPEYFQNQNDAIDAGTLSAEKINLVALGINNGWIDATIQYGAYVDFAYNNSYRQLINESEYVSLKEEFETGCLPRLQACPGETGTDAACQDADDFCYENVEAYVVSLTTQSRSRYRARKCVSCFHAKISCRKTLSTLMFMIFDTLLTILSHQKPMWITSIEMM